MKPIQSATLEGINAVGVIVSYSARSVPLSFAGISAVTAKEIKVRVSAALQAAERTAPAQGTITAAPIELRKQGAILDLAIACAALIAGGLDGAALDGLLVIGELGLDGRTRQVRGALAAALLAKQAGLRGIVVPEANVQEALEAEIPVYGVRHLREIVGALAGDRPLVQISPARFGDTSPRDCTPDMAEVRDQATAVRAAEISAAGGHSLLLQGPPGTGKTMLARRIPSILPELTRSEQIEAMLCHSAIGVAGFLIRVRPFRAPHHTISAAALVGSAANLRPGEVSLAHTGVLFLDEIGEFNSTALGLLRDSITMGATIFQLATGSITLPARVHLVASANPCPCGWHGSKVRECTCTPTAIECYQQRLSAATEPFEIRADVAALSLTDLQTAKPGPSSAEIRARVIKARARQAARFEGYHGTRCNADMSGNVATSLCHFTTAGAEAFDRLIQKRAAFGPGLRVLRVARTIADLADADLIGEDHVREAAALVGAVP